MHSIVRKKIDLLEKNIKENNKKISETIKKNDLISFQELLDKNDFIFDTINLLKALVLELKIAKKISIEAKENREILKNR